jgi:hypothetical protein
MWCCCLCFELSKGMKPTSPSGPAPHANHPTHSRSLPCLAPATPAARGLVPDASRCRRGGAAGAPAGPGWHVATDGCPDAGRRQAHAAGGTARCALFQPALWPGCMVFRLWAGPTAGVPGCFRGVCLVEVGQRREGLHIHMHVLALQSPMCCFLSRCRLVTCCWLAAIHNTYHLLHWHTV